MPLQSYQGPLTNDQKSTLRAILEQPAILEVLEAAGLAEAEYYRRQCVDMALKGAPTRAIEYAARASMWEEMSTGLKRQAEAK